MYFIECPFLEHEVSHTTHCVQYKLPNTSIIVLSAISTLLTCLLLLLANRNTVEVNVVICSNI